MALSLQLSYCQTNGCKTLRLTDITGEYDADSNAGGWNGANVPQLNSVTAGTLVFTDPSGTEHSFSCETDCGIDWATETVDTLIFDLANTKFGLASTAYITDGIWTVVYTVADSEVEENSATVTRMFAVYCALQCKLDQLMAMIPEQYNCNKCNVTFLNEVTKAFMLFEAMKNAAYCGSVSEFDNLYDTIDNLINTIKYGL